MMENLRTAPSPRDFLMKRFLWFNTITGDLLPYAAAILAREAMFLQKQQEI